MDILEEIGLHLRIVSQFEKGARCEGVHTVIVALHLVLGVPLRVYSSTALS